MTRQVVLALWAATAAAVAGYVALSAVRPDVAGVATLLTRLVARRWRMAGAVLVWMWLGWHFFAR